MSDPYEVNPEALESLWTGVNGLLGEAAAAAPVDRDASVEANLRPSADFAKEILMGLQVRHSYFDAEEVARILAMDALGIYTHQTHVDAVGDIPEDTVLRYFAGGLMGLHRTLADGPLDDNLLDLAAEQYNTTMACLEALSQGNTDAFERMYTDLEFYLGPITVGKLNLDEAGRALPPEEEVSIRDLVHERLTATLAHLNSHARKIIPLHDSRSSMQMDISIQTFRLAERFRALQRQANNNGSVAPNIYDWLYDELDTLVATRVSGEWSHLSDAVRDELTIVMQRGVVDMLSALSDLDQPE